MKFKYINEIIQTLFMISLLRCPETGSSLQNMSAFDLGLKIFRFGKEITVGLVNESQTIFYPILMDIYLLLPEYAEYLTDDISKNNMEFDQKRVFDYYNEIDFKSLDDNSVYEDSSKWVDYRDITHDYIRNSFKRVKNYINEEGDFFLDIASGPIGTKEYMDLSSNYRTRICIDTSFNALLHAKKNWGNRSGIFICGDITNIPLKDNVMDAVVSQHTLYHIHKDLQSKAVEELYRVAKPNTKVAIVYSWFYHSWLMNLTLFPIQLFIVLKYFASKAYVNLFNSKPRLYFYPHSPRWFKKLPMGDKIEFYCWRSTNKVFLRTFIHRAFFGRQILDYITHLEEKYPRKMAILGDYSIILIHK